MAEKIRRKYIRNHIGEREGRKIEIPLQKWNSSKAAINQYMQPGAGQKMAESHTEENIRQSENPIIRKKENRLRSGISGNNHQSSMAYQRNRWKKKWRNIRKSAKAPHRKREIMKCWKSMKKSAWKSSKIIDNQSKNNLRHHRHQSRRRKASARSREIEKIPA